MAAMAAARFAPPAAVPPPSPGPLCLCLLCLRLRWPAAGASPTRRSGRRGLKLKASAAGGEGRGAEERAAMRARAGSRRAAMACKGSFSVAILFSCNIESAGCKELLIIRVVFYLLRVRSMHTSGSSMHTTPASTSYHSSRVLLASSSTNTTRHVHDTCGAI